MNSETSKNNARLPFGSNDGRDFNGGDGMENIVPLFGGMGSIFFSPLQNPSF